MTRRSLKIATGLSTAMLTIALVLFAASCFVSPHYISLNKSFHVSIWRTHIVFFNDAEYGPYRGSIIALADANGNADPPFKRERAFLLPILSMVF